MKMTIEELERREQELCAKVRRNFDEAEAIAAESRRVAQVAANAPAIIRDLDKEFESVTRLSQTDVAFLFVATALQLVRQYLVTFFPQRLDDASAARATKGHHEEHSNRSHKYYSPSLEEIITNPVPFDANVGAHGALSGGGKMGHRVTALGHDPILGLIVGTSNIATSTLTNNRLESFHIYTSKINGRNHDVFHNRAHTALVFQKTYDKLMNQGWKGKEIIGASLMKEIIHLRSDLYTKHSLPLPLVSALDGVLASKLAGYGLDMANVITGQKQAAVNILINSMIAMVHGAFMPEGFSSPTYEVRTRRILLYSNMIASSSNLIFVGANAALGNEDMLRKLDVGGLIVTCYRVASDSKFIAAAKQEFIEKKFFEKIKGDSIY